MAKFINKKEQVIDLKLTTYGRHLLSKGALKPVYYAFYDDNVLYDGLYADKHETQNEIQNRIKNETSYIEGLTLFHDIETTVTDASVGRLETADTVLLTPREDIYKFDASIGDAKLDGSTQLMPSWRIVALEGAMSSSFMKDEMNETHVPQINVTAKYSLKTMEPANKLIPTSVRGMLNSTRTFVDNKEIRLIPQDPLFYIEEVNTDLLTDNFDLEVFEILTGSNGSEIVTQLTRKYFKKQVPQIENDILIFEQPVEIPDANLTTSSVEFYFDIPTDLAVDHAAACRGAEHFNKESYYIELGFECDDSDSEAAYHDIYGSTMEPEICQ